MQKSFVVRIACNRRSGHGMQGRPCLGGVEDEVAGEDAQEGGRIPRRQRQRSSRLRLRTFVSHYIMLKPDRGSSLDLSLVEAECHRVSTMK